MELNKRSTKQDGILSKSSNTQSDQFYDESLFTIIDEMEQENEVLSNPGSVFGASTKSAFNGFGSKSSLKNPVTQSQ
jgi:hypothetical protein